MFLRADYLQVASASRSMHTARGCPPSSHFAFLTPQGCGICSIDTWVCNSAVDDLATWLPQVAEFWLCFVAVEEVSIDTSKILSPIGSMYGIFLFTYITFTIIYPKNRQNVVNVGKYIDTQAHRIHVQWYISLHLVNFYGKCMYVNIPYMDPMGKMM